MTETNDAPERISDLALAAIADAADQCKDGKWFEDPGNETRHAAKYLFLTAPTAVLSMARELQRLRAATTPRPMSERPQAEYVLVHYRGRDGSYWEDLPVANWGLVSGDPDADGWLPLPEDPAP